MDRTRITDHQLMSLAVNSATGGGILIMPSILSRIARQDAWLVPLLTAALGLPVIWIMLYLGTKYPDKSFIDIIRAILGKWLGFIVAASYLFILFMLSCNLPWYVGNFITTDVMPETPPYVIRLVYVIVVAAALLYGLEAFARASEIFLYFITILFALAMIFVAPNIKPENLQPVLEKGIVPVFKGSFVLASVVLFPLINLLMIYPFNIRNAKKAEKAIFKAFIWTNTLVFISVLMSVLVLGAAMTVNLRFATYTLAKEIDVGDIFTRLEFIIAIVWITTELYIGLVSFYAFTTGLSGLLGLKEHKRIVLPLSLIILVLSGVVLPDSIYQESWFGVVWVPYSATFGLVVPLFLVLVYLLKGKKV